MRQRHRLRGAERCRVTRGPGRAEGAERCQDAPGRGKVLRAEAKSRAKRQGTKRGKAALHAPNNQAAQYTPATRAQPRRTVPHAPHTRAHSTAHNAHNAPGHAQHTRHPEARAQGRGETRGHAHRTGAYGGARAREGWGRVLNNRAKFKRELHPHLHPPTHPAPH